MSRAARAVSTAIVFAACAAGVRAQAPAGLPGLPPRAQTQEEMSKPAPIPDGFVPLFNGNDLTGWHVSRTNHHGATPDYRVVQGVIVGTQNPPGGGGILLTDRKYKNFELFVEVRPDWGCDSGLFLRSSEAGEAYQVTMDYLPGGTIGGIYGEALQGVTPRPTPGAPNTQEAWVKAWRREEWNTVRARIEGDVPHIQVWINGTLVTDFTDTANHAAGGAVDGMIAIQVHMNGVNNGVPYSRWVPGGFWRWRTIAVKSLP